MSFTNLSTIKKHLLSSGFAALEIKDYPLTLSGTNDLELPHHDLVEDSDAVKWVAGIAPFHDASVTLSGYNWASLSNSHLVPGSAVVTLGPSLTTIYTEGPDYQVDHTAGKIRRVPGTTIPDQQAVHVYALKYSLFTRTTDYVIDCGLGTIHRTSGGAIPDGAAVLMDYTVTAGSVEDDLILQAITETQDLIVRHLAPEYTGESTDQGLKTGATELVLSILARALATEALSRRTSSDAASRAKEWQNLSNLYEVQAWRTLRPFLASLALHSPEKISNA